MAAGKCDLCDKRTVFGRSIQYKHGGQWERRAPKTNRPFMPNVHAKRLFVDGRWQRLNACTRCLRTQSKHQQAKGVPQAMLLARPA